MTTNTSIPTAYVVGLRYTGVSFSFCGSCFGRNLPRCPTFQGPFEYKRENQTVSTFPDREVLPMTPFLPTRQEKSRKQARLRKYLALSLSPTPPLHPYKHEREAGDANHSSVAPLPPPISGEIRPLSAADLTRFNPLQCHLWMRHL